MDENNNYDQQYQQYPPPQPQQPPQYPPPQAPPQYQQQPPQYPPQAPPPQYPSQQYPPQPPQYQQPYAPPQEVWDPGKGMAIASLVLGLASFPLSWAFVGIGTAIAGLILGILSMKKSKAAGFPTGLAMAGTICSAIFLAFSIIITIACTAALCSATNYLDSYNW